MFLGHYGIAFAARRLAPRASLGTTIFAAQFLDELWPVLLLLGVEQVRIVPGLMAASDLDFVSYPISHSLLTTVLWSLLIGGLHYAGRRDARTSAVVGATVASHWFLDLPMHRPDLPLWPGGAAPRVGLGLWNSVPATAVIEGSLLAIGVVLYVRSTRPRDGIGRWGLWGMIAFLVASFAGSGTPPPSEKAVAWVTLALWLMVPWGWWVDRHREPVVRAPVQGS